MTYRFLRFAVLILTLLLWPSTVFAQSALSSTTCPGTGCVVINTSGQGSTGVQLAGTFAGTLTFEQSIDGVTWFAWSVTPSIGGTAVTTATTTGHWIGSTFGVRLVRIRMSAYTSGTVSVFTATSLARATGGGTTFTGGTLTSSLAAPAADYCAAVPYSFTGDTNTGLCSSAADTVNLITGGTSRVTLTTTTATSTVPFLAPDGATGAPSYSFTSNPDTGLYLSGSNLRFTSDNSLKFAFTAVSVDITANGYGVSFGGNVLIQNTAPTIASGFCTSPVITANGTAAFRITIGSACAGSIGTLTMPAATTGWNCDFFNSSVPASNTVAQTGGSTTTVDVTNYARTTGLAANFTDGHVVRGKCLAF